MSDPKLGIGTNRCLCSGCDRYFTTVANFDAHHVGKSQERRCIDPSTLMRKNGDRRFKLNGSGLWAGMPSNLEIIR